MNKYTGYEFLLGNKGMETFQFRSLPTATFMIYPPAYTSIITGKGKVTLLELVTEECNNATEPENTDLLAWIRFYLKKDVIDIEAEATARGKIIDLFKLVAFMHYNRPSLDIKYWDLQLTQHFVNELEKSYAFTSVFKMYTSITNFYTFLRIHEVIHEKNNPTRNVKLTRPLESPYEGLYAVDADGQELNISGDEIYGHMIEVARDRITREQLPARSRPYRDAALLSFLYGTGLRVDESCSVRRNQWKPALSKDGIWFENVLCKGRLIRNAYLQSIYVHDINAYDLSNERKASEPWLFQSYRWNQLTQSTVWAVLNDIAEEAALKYLPAGSRIVVSPHSLRHERGYKLKEAGKGDAFVAKGLGQRDLRQVKRYSRPNRCAEEADYEEV